MHAQLEILSGTRHGAVIPLVKRQYLFGRAPDCDFILDDVTVSRHHCVLTLDERGTTLCDLGSTNGTQVNRTLIDSSKLPLFDGDELRVGFWRARIKLDSRVRRSDIRPPNAGMTTKFFVRDDTPVDAAAPDFAKVGG